MKNIDKRVIVVALILVGGIVWIFTHLSFGKTKRVPDVTGADIDDTYPSSGTPVLPSSFSVGDSPTYLTYNIAKPDLASLTPKSGDCAGCSGCKSIPQAALALNVPQSTVDAQLLNLQSVGL
jgi:hypothetical protein